MNDIDKQLLLKTKTALKEVLRGIDELNLAVSESLMLWYDFEAVARLINGELGDGECLIEPVVYLERVNERYMKHIRALEGFTKQIYASYREVSNIISGAEDDPEEI